MLLGLLLAGCSVWQQPLEEPSELPSLQPGARSSTLEIFFVHLPQEVAEPEAIWAEVDEQHLAPGVRQRLADNGIRCGLVGSELPTAVKQLMETAAARSPLSHPLHTVNVRRIPLPPDQSREIVTSSIQPQMIVLHRRGGRPEGEIFEQAQGVLRVRCKAQSSTQARLWLVPEIHHGQPRSRFEPRQGAFQVVTRRNIEAFESLTIDTPLAEGQHLLVTCSDPPKGVGACLFGEAGVDQTLRQLLIVRLADLPPAELFPAPSSAGSVADGWQ